MFEKADSDITRPNTFTALETGRVPVGHDTREVALLVLVHFRVAHQDEGAVSAVGSDHARARDRLGEMRVNGRTADRLQTLQLARRGDVKPLRASRRGNTKRYSNTPLYNHRHVLRQFWRTHTHTFTSTKKAHVNKTPVALIQTLMMRCQFWSIFIQFKAFMTDSSFHFTNQVWFFTAGVLFALKL